MGIGASANAAVIQDVDCEGNVVVGESIICTPAQFTVCENVVVSSKKIDLSTENILHFQIHGAGVFRIGILSNDPSDRVDCTQEAVYEIEIGIGAGDSERILYVDNGRYFCFGADKDNCKEYKYVKDKQFYVYVMCIFGEPILKANQGNNVVEWKQTADGNPKFNLTNDGKAVQFGIGRDKATLVWRNAIKPSGVYNLEWKMLLERHTISGKIPKYGFLRMGLFANKPSANGFAFKNPGSSSSEIWFTESAVIAYPYSNTLAFKIEPQKICHNVLVESVDNISTEDVDFDCKQDLYLAVEMFTGDIKLAEGPNRIQQTLGSTFFVEDFEGDDEDDHSDILDKISSVCKEDPCRLQFGCNETKFVVEFRKNINVKELKQLEGNVKEIGEVKMVQVVAEAGENLEKYDVEQEFNRKFEVEVATKGNNVWILTFTSEKDARRVWMETEWVIEQTKVTVLPYYAQLGISFTKGRKPSRIETTKSIKIQDEDKLKFIKENDNARDHLTDHMKNDAGVTILWNDSTRDDEVVVRYSGFDNSWYETASSSVTSFIKEFTIPKGNNPYIPTNTSSEKTFPRNVFDKIAYMESKGMLAKTLEGFPSSRFSIDKRKREAKLKGPTEEIQKAYNKIHEQALTINIVNISISKSLAEILKETSAQQTLFGSLQGIKKEDFEIVETICRIWLVHDPGRASDTKVQRVREMVEGSIRKLFVDQGELPVRPEAFSTLATNEWEEFRNKLMKKKLVYIEVTELGDSKLLKITTTCTSYEEVRTKVNDFLAATTKGKDRVFVGRDVALYLSEHDLVGKDNVCLMKDSTGNCTGFVTVNGTDDERANIKKSIAKARQSIKVVWFHISKPWLASAITELTDRNFEFDKKCIMHFEIANHLSEELIPCVALFRKSGCCLFVMQTDITKACCDVIVNSTNNKLQCDYGFSKVLCRAAGDKVVNECKAHIKTKQEMPLGEVFVGMPGSLMCCKIFHVACAQQDGDTTVKLSDLKTAVTNVLKAADSQQYSSIMIPAIGCGGKGSTTKDNTLAIVEAVSEYMTKNDKSSIREIYLSDIIEERINAFTDAVEKVMTKQFVFKHGRPLPKLGDDANSTTSSRFGKSLAKTRLLKQPKGQNLRFMPGNLRPELPSAAMGDSIASNSNGQSNNRNPFSSGLPYKIDISENLSLHVEAGSIEAQNVDVIVNTSAHFPEMGSAVSKAIIRAGGKGVVEECRRKGKEDFEDRKIIRTSGGNMQCKHIYHVKIDMAWNRNIGFERIYNTVSACLQEADKYKCRSISFPSIGTGASRYPADKVANGMVSAVCNFTNDNPNSSIRNVHIMIFYADSAIQQIFEQQVPLTLEPSGLLDNIQTGQVITKNRPSHPKLKYTNPGDHTIADDVVVIKLIAADDVKKLIQELEKEVESEYEKRLLPYGKDLKELSESEEILIKGLGKGHFMSLEIDKQKKEVTISGLSRNIGPVEAKVREMMTLKIPELRQKHEMGQQIAATVEWHYDNNGTSTPVSAPNNFEIQMNYLSGRDFEYKNTLDEKMYKVLFNTMEEHPTGQPDAKRRLYQKVKVSIDGIGLPDLWTIAQTQEVTKRVTLSPQDAEFQAVKKALIQGRCPFSQIVNIIRIEDKFKWLQYQTKKQQLEKQNPSGVTNERQLWHGTDTVTVDKIITGGYDRNFRGKNATYYGEGVYFAVTSEYSNRYAHADANNVKRMFYNKVLSGEYCQGTQGMGFLPVKGTKGGYNVLYDSAVDDMKSPVMYVIFHDTQAYPEYLIEYK